MNPGSMLASPFAICDIAIQPLCYKPTHHESLPSLVMDKYLISVLSLTTIHTCLTGQEFSCTPTRLVSLVGHPEWLPVVRPNLTPGSRRLQLGCSSDSHRRATPLTMELAPLQHRGSPTYSSGQRLILLHRVHGWFVTLVSHV